MNKNIDQALRKIELGKKAFDEAEEILAELLQEDLVPRVMEQEPMSDPVEDRMDEVGISYEDKTPPRSDLVCPCELQCKVYDNRPNKKSGQYKQTAPDFTCSNNTDCSNQKQGHTRVLRKSWWLDSNDLPQEWIKTVVPPISAEDTVDVTGSEDEIHPFDQ